MFKTSLSKKRLVGVALFLLIVLPFFLLNRFPKLDTVREDVGVVSQPAVECFQGFCVEDEPESSFLSRWVDFSVIYLRLVTVGMVFAFLVGALTEAFLFPRSTGVNLLAGGTFKRTLKGLAIAPVLNVCSACIVPVAVGFHRRGAGIAGTIALVQGSATMNLLAMFMVFSVFTPLMASSRVVLTVVGALLIGPLVARAVHGRGEDPLTEPFALDVAEERDAAGWGPVLAEAFRDWAKASIRYLVQLGPIMVVAGFASGLAMQWIDQSTVSTYLGNHLLGVAIAATLGVLVNVPLLFEIPLVALLLLMGAGPAPAAVLLFTAAAGGPITYWGLAKVMPRRAIATFATATWALGLIGGLAVWALVSVAPGLDFGFKPSTSAASAAPLTSIREGVPDVEFGDTSQELRGHRLLDLIPTMSRTAVIYGGLEPIMDPKFLTVEETPALFRDEEPVIGVFINGEARAYPIDILSRHEAVNDVVGGRPIVVTWCPLVYIGVVYDREVAGATLTFGITGFLMMNNLVLFDHETDNWWVQMTGDSVKGAQAGEQLERIPFTQTTWGRWKALHPDTLVLDENLGYTYDPYENYYASNWTAGGRLIKDDTLPRKETVLGVWVNETAKAYGFSDLAAQPVANDTVGGTDIVVTFDPETSTVGGAFNRRLGDRSLTFQPDASDPLLMVDTETGSSWAVLTGEAVRGALVGSRLEQVESNYAFWFAWKDWHPSTQVFRKGETGS